MIGVIVAVGGWIERTEKRGVVRPRRYEFVGSHFAAVMSFWLERDVEREGDIPDCYIALCSWTGWGRRETQKGRR